MVHTLPPGTGEKQPYLLGGDHTGINLVIDVTPDE